MTGRALTERLKSAPWLRRPETQHVLRLLDGDNARTRAVGGIVRDTLLGLLTGPDRSETDIDLATELRPDEVMARAKDAGIAAYPTGLAHGTVTLRAGGLTAEVTTLREDIETDGRHAVVKFGTNWTRDAARRDFTLNALYAASDGTLLDPINGLADCLAGKVRFIGNADQRIAEDRLRVYRFFRFSASHGKEQLDAEGLAACRRAAGTLSGLSAERVGGEMRRMLNLPRMAATLRAMRDAGILALGDETLERLLDYGRRAYRPDFSARLAIIMAPADAPDLKALWRLSNDEIKVGETVLHVARLLAGYALNEAAYRHPAALADGIEVAAALAGWTEAGKSAVIEQLASLNVPQFPLAGDDLINLGLAPGPQLGLELERLEQLWIAGGFALGRDELLAKARH